MKRSIAALCGLAALVGGGAQGQTQAPPAPPFPAAASQPSARALELSRQIVVSVGSDTMQGMMHQMLASMAATMPAAATPEDENVNREMMIYANKIVVAEIPRIQEISINIYATSYTEDQLAGILAFYQSPTGQAVINNMPKLGGKLGLAMTPILHEVERDVALKACELRGCDAQALARLNAMFPAPPST